MAEEMAPEHITLRTLLESTDQEILGMAEQVHLGEYMLAPQWTTLPVTGQIHGRATSRAEWTYD